MLFKPYPWVQHILILGAGASVDYGLPIWTGLGTLLGEVANDPTNTYEYKGEIAKWANSVGKGKKYSTIDECITKESELNFSEGHKVEDEIFLAIRDIFIKAYKSNNEGWIRALNKKILSNKLESKLAFINYNYDDVLERNLLDFAYLPEKRRILNDAPRLEKLAGARIDVFYPHGNLFDLKNKQIRRFMSTMKSNHKEFIDAVSCYESDAHAVNLEETSPPINLYFLGLGSGLQTNLNNIDFQLGRYGVINEIHVTIKDESLKDNIIDFLTKKFNIAETSIKIYKTCDELVASCFS